MRSYIYIYMVKSIGLPRRNTRRKCYKVVVHKRGLNDKRPPAQNVRPLLSIFAAHQPCIIFNIKRSVSVLPIRIV